LDYGLLLQAVQAIVTGQVAQVVKVLQGWS